MFTFLDPRLYLAVLLLAAGCFAGGYLKGHQNGVKEIRYEWTQAKLTDAQDARRLEQRRQDRAGEAQRLDAARQMAIRRDAAGARAQRDGLRGDLDALQRYAAQSADASAKSVAALGAVFESCTRRYLDVAEDAAGHASDSLMYQQAWPE